MSEPARQRAQLHELHVGGTAEAWQSIGFAVDDSIRIRSTLLCPTGTQTPIVGAVVDGVTELDGLAVACEPFGGSASATPHANGVIAIDHVVVLTPDAARTQRAFESAGIDTRRVRRFETSKGPRRQAFHWFGDVLCEVAGPEEPTGTEVATFWGLALTVRDIDETADYLGDRVSTVKDGVQRGRRVTTLQSSPDIPVPILFISEHVAPKNVACHE